MAELLLRFVIGGLVVSAFSLVGDLFKPQSFGGLFGAAPSVAIATLSLAILKDGNGYAAREARSMMAGAAALFVYAELIGWLVMRRKLSVMQATVGLLPVWFAIAFAGWYAFLR